jgi:hypothetical protein
MTETQTGSATNISQVATAMVPVGRTGRAVLGG